MPRCLHRKGTSYQHRLPRQVLFSSLLYPLNCSITRWSCVYLLYKRAIVFGLSAAFLRRDGWVSRDASGAEIGCLLSEAGDGVLGDPPSVGRKQLWMGRRAGFNRHVNIIFFLRFASVTHHTVHSKSKGTTCTETTRLPLAFLNLGFLVWAFFDD